MEKIEFFDLRTKQKFCTDKYEIKTNARGGKYAETISSSGTKCFRVLKK